MLGTYLGKHLEDLMIDVEEAAGHHLIPEICLNWSVLLGGEEKARGVAALGQSGPAGHGDRGDTGQSREGPLAPHPTPSILLAPGVLVTQLSVSLGPRVAAYWKAPAAILP